VRDVPQHLRPQLLHRGKAPVAKHTLLDAREEQLDLVEPGGVQGRVVEVETRAVARVEAGPAFVRTIVVNVEIVPDDVDLALRVLLRDPLHEPKKVLGFTLPGDLRDHVARLGVERGEQGAGAVALVFVLVAARPPAPRPLRRVLPAQRLHPRLLVHGQHHRPGGRVEVQPADVGRLRPKRRVLTVDPSLYAVRSEGGIA
jgi:hypothetical protein